MPSTQTRDASVRIAAKLPATVHQDFQVLATELGIDFNTGVKMALLQSISLYQKGLSPFGYLPVASYSNCRDGISKCLKLGIDQAAFDILYANPQTSKKVSIQSHVNFLDDGIVSKWSYRDGSTNEKLCLRILWALNQIDQMNQIKKHPSRMASPEGDASETVNWIDLAKKAAHIYP